MPDNVKEIGKKLNSDQLRVFIALLGSLLKFVEKPVKRFFVHGEAGTGKTYFLTALQDACKEMVLVNF